MPNLLTVNEYNLTSDQSDFTISFDYQKQSYVSVKVEDSSFVDVSSNYSGVFTDATTYQFQDVNGNPELIPSGYRVTFTRDTDISDDLFTFAAGTVIRPDALGESLKTLRDYTEEKNDQTANVTINIANDAITTATQTATTKASEASASATAAAGSASAASTSATNAATSETNAGTSETNAAASAAAAGTSETNAGTSETNAAASAAAAATSETNAGTSETNAATSETNAATSATNAAASETAAEAAKDAVLDVFLGSFADDLAVDAYLSGVSYTKDIGDLYFNTTDGFMKVYTGSGWVYVANTVSSDLAAISATAAQTAQTAAEAALSTFVNRYLGTYTNVNNDDNEVNTAKSSVIDAGDIYFDSSNTILKYYDGNGWQPAAAVSVLNTTNLGNVGDVDYTTAPQSGDYLYRNASNQWERRAVGDVKTDLNLPTDAATDISANATAISNNTTAISNNATAISNNTTAIANNATAISNNTTAIANNATAISNNTTAIANNATAISTNSTAITGKQDTITTSTALGAASLTTVVDSANVDVREAAVIDSGAVTTSQDLVGDAALYNVTGTGVVLTLDTTALTAGTIVSIYANGYDVILRQTATTANQFGVVRLDGDTTTNRGGTGTIADTTIANGTLATITVVSSGEAVIAGQGVS